MFNSSHGQRKLTISSRKFPPKKGVDGDISKGNKRELSRDRNVRSEWSTGLLLLQTENLVSEWVMVGKKQINLRQSQAVSLIFGLLKYRMEKF